MAEPRASATASRPRSRLAAWAAHHGDSLGASLGRMLRRPWSTLLTVGVMAVALALPLGLWLSLHNIGRLGGTVEASRQISLFLKTDVAPARASALAGELRARPDVAEVELRTPDQALAQLQAEAGPQATLYAETVDALGENPLPAVLIVHPAGRIADGAAGDTSGTTVADAALATALDALPEVDLVQRDARWRERLDGWLGFGARLVWVLAVLLGLGALLVVGNTVRLEIQERREEIAVLQLLGATDGFIRRPFLYLGVWYGLAAGLLALSVLTVAELALRAPLARLAASYGSGFALQGLDAPQALAVLAVAALLGWLGAGVVTGHFLGQTRPD